MPKNYIKGSVKQIKSGDLIVSVKVEDLMKIANERGYAAVVIAERRNVDEYGNTHYIYENTYKKNRSESGELAVKQADVDDVKPAALEALKTAAKPKPSPKKGTKSSSYFDDVPF